MMVTYHLLSNKGSRKKNEDRLGSYKRDNEFCFTLADGLGGHGKGELASKIVVDTSLDVFKEEGFSEFFIRGAFELSQENLLKKQQELRMPDDIKTTMILLCISESKLEWGHIGDSRLYMFKNKKYLMHTLDHSVPQMLVNIGEISDEDIRHHPDRSHLLKVMGIEWDRPKYDISQTIEPEAGMAFLLASDGFWELVDEKTMVRCLRRSFDVRDWIYKMEKHVIKNGQGKDMDNYSAIGVWINK